MTDRQPSEAQHVTSIPQPAVSIIVPVFNVASYLVECLESLRLQTTSDFEVVVIDDGSTDGSGAICDEYAQRDTRFRVIHKSNGGLVRARQTGLAQAKGEYIGFVDGDDWVDVEMVRLLHHAAVDAGADIVSVSALLEYSDRTDVLSQYLAPGVYDKERLKLELYPRLFFTGEYYEFGLLPSLCFKLFRRSLIERHLPRVPFGIRVGEDAACSFTCLLNASCVVVMGDTPYHYRQHQESMMHVRTGGQFESALTLYLFLKRETQNQPADLGVQLEVFFIHLLWEHVRKVFVGFTAERLAAQLRIALQVAGDNHARAAAKSAKTVSLPTLVRHFATLVSTGQGILLFGGLWAIKLLDRARSGLRMQVRSTQDRGLLPPTVERVATRVQRSVAYRTRHQRWLLRDILTSVADFIIPYSWDSDRYPEEFITREQLVSWAVPVSSLPRVVWCFWTGENELTENRTNSLLQLQAMNPDLELRLVTPLELPDYEQEGHSFHPAYQFLSLNHRSDYLRCYFMHHYGGVYSDIKKPLYAWAGILGRLEDSPTKWAIGYRELGHRNVAQLPGRLGHDLRTRFRRVIGNGVFAFRPRTPFTAEWLGEVESRLDRHSPELSRHPGNMWGDNPGYPIAWAGLQAEVMQPLCLKYNARLMFDNKLRPSFVDYR